MGGGDGVLTTERTEREREKGWVKARKWNNSRACFLPYLGKSEEG